MKVFDKMLKKELTEEELQAKEDSMMKSSEEKYEEDQVLSENASPKKSSSPSTSDRAYVQLEKDVELLKIQLELIKQQKTVSDEKFSHFSEQIGEIRATVLDSERDGATIKMQAEKSIELIQMVQPEKVMQNIKKLELKVEEAKAVEEKFSAMQQKLIDELKELRQRTDAIRGSETILKLNEQVKEELSSALSVQAKMEAKADKVEAMFADFQQHYYEYQKVFDRMKELNLSFNDISKDFNVFKVKVESSASKSDFVKLKEEIKGYGNELDLKLVELEKAGAKTAMIRDDLMKDLNDEMDSVKKEILQKVSDVSDAKQKIDSMKSDLQKSLQSENAILRKDVDSKINSVQNDANSRLLNLEKDVDERISKIEAISESLPKLSKTVAGLEEDSTELAELKAFFEKSSKDLSSLKETVRQIESSLSKFEKIADQLETLTSESKDAKGIRFELEKRLKSVEAKSEELVNKANRKLDSVVSDTQDNTTVLRDLLKDLYSLKTHSANSITKNDLNATQKSINEKLIAFDMMLIKLEHRITDADSTMRAVQKEFSTELKEYKKENDSKIRELEKSKKFQDSKAESTDIK
ncbi:hypothetical protein HY989_06565 [Candidatus Micrarchaeota archaeon]|nr:hypothetical protein [Candidatus Micrarchaeota archaeon]